MDLDTCYWQNCPRRSVSDRVTSSTYLQRLQPNWVDPWLHIWMLIMNKNNIVSREYKYRFWMWIDLIKTWTDIDFLNFAPVGKTIVTVMPSTAKIFERIIHMQMTKHFESFFYAYLFAYSKFLSCPTALLALTEAHWRAELDRRKVVGAVLIDHRKAFDCVPHDLIIDKLNFHVLEDNSFSLLRSYLSSRYQWLKLGNTFST